MKKKIVEKLNKKVYMLYLLLIIPFLTSCQYLPQIAKDVEDIATDTAIKIEISRETFQKETDLQIQINVQNKDEPKEKS